MVGAIFTEQLKRTWRQIFYWGIGLAFLSFYVLAVIQDVDFLTEYASIFQQMPAGFLNALGIEDAATIASAEGLIGLIYTYGIITMMVFAVTAGMNITANDEDDGIIDVVLALPIPRWRIIVEKYMAYTLIVIAIVLCSYLGVIAGRMVMPEEIPLNMERVFYATLNMIPTTMVAMAFTAFVASIVIRKRIVMGISTGFVIGSYFFWVADNATTNALTGFMGRISIFTYFDSEKSLRLGVEPINPVIMLVAALILVVTATYAFERRDVGL